MSTKAAPKKREKWTVGRLVGALTELEGFVRTEHPGWLAFDDLSPENLAMARPIIDSEAHTTTVAYLSNEKDRLLLCHVQDEHYGPGTPSGITGTTAYKTKSGHWLSFDRRGIDDSFGFGGDMEDPMVTLRGQLEKIDKYRAASAERDRDGVTVEICHGQTHRLLPKEIAEITKTFKEQGFYEFRPNGMGVGYLLNTRKLHSWAAPVPEETARIFGQARLFMTTTDCD